MALPGDNNGSKRFISDSSHSNFWHVVPETDPNNTLYLNLHEKSQILSDPTLDFISRCLLEEDIDVNADGYHEKALRDMEKPFYDILGKEYYTPSEGNRLLLETSFVNPNSIHSISNNHVCPDLTESLEQKLSKENLFVTEFHKGVEEGIKFLPNLKNLSTDSSVDQKDKSDNNLTELRLWREKGNSLLDRSRGKKSSNDDDLDILEGRNCKIPPIFCEAIRDETLDKVLLYNGESYEKKEISSLREIMKLKENSQKQDDHTDLKALLTACAEAVSTNNKKIAGELLNEIRKQAHPTGDGIQRFACILANGLEARLAGVGSVTYRQLVMKQVSTTDVLKAFHISVRASPTMRVMYHFANKSILNNVGNASQIHVIDFGIFFGLQWPSLIQALAKREGGPPKLRITGVDFPQPGFRPAQRVKETGRMLENYARDFEVPFEYQGVISEWESICIDNFNLKDGEVLIINSMFQYLDRVKDEPLLGMNSPKSKLLKLIFEVKPQVFIHGIFNFFVSPFFMARFKNVLLQFSKMFETIDTLIPRDDLSRQFFERVFYAPPVVNLIACEGSDLVVRTETYKQWHKRHLQIGFEQILPDSTIVKECNRIVKNGYKDGFFVEEDCNWIVLGWNGNIYHAISLWEPTSFIVRE